MRKNIYFLIVIFFLAISSFYYSFQNEISNLNKEKNQNYQVILRYKFQTTQEINFPNYLKSTKPQLYSAEFNLVNSDIKFFETLTFDNQNCILDYKNKYVQKINYQDLRVDILVNVFDISKQLSVSIIDVLSNGRTITERKKALENWSIENNQKILYEKGLKKMIKF